MTARLEGLENDNTNTSSANQYSPDFGLMSMNALQLSRTKGGREVLDIPKINKKGKLGESLRYVVHHATQLYRRSCARDERSELS